MIARALRPAVAALALWAGGCRPAKAPVVDFSDARKAYQPRDYPQVLTTWTRQAKLVRDVGTVLEVTATYKSWDFRQAYIEKYAAVYDLAPSERDQLQRAQLEQSREVHEVHAVVQSTSHTWNDLEKKSSPWRVTLVDGAGAELAPSSIDVPKFPELYESQFFPDRTPFSRTYVFRFARADAPAFGGARTGRITLRIAGPLGKAEVSWAAR